MTITIPKIAYEHLSHAARCVKMTCKSPKFNPIKLVKSECGTYEYFKDERMYFIIFNKTQDTPAFAKYGFYRGDHSNFSGIETVGLKCEDKIWQTLLNIRFDCGEQYFKLMCALLHVDETGKNLNVVHAVLNAAEPKDAKSATFKIDGFDGKKWDLVSADAMYHAQLQKLLCPEFHQRYIDVARLAKEHGVLPVHVFFTEDTEGVPAVDAVAATETTPEVKARKEQKADLIWGTGVGLEESFRLSIADPANLFDSLLDPENLCGRSDRLFDGKNRLGTSIDRAFMELVGPDYKFIDEPIEEFVRRAMAERKFDFLVYEPVAEERPTTPVTFTENAELVDGAGFVTPADKITGPPEEPPAKRSRSDRSEHSEHSERSDHLDRSDYEPTEEEALEDLQLTRSMSCARSLSAEY